MERDKLIQITRQKKVAESDFHEFVNEMYEQIWGRLFPLQFLTHDLSNTVSGNIITPDDEPIPDCITCGACCGSLICVGVDPGNPISSEDCWEITKEGENSEFTVDLYIKRNEENFSCSKLEGEIGEKVSCSIYETRPPMCHAFEAGSDRCHAIRRAYGFEPFLSLTEMFEARQKMDLRDNESDSEVIVSAVFVERGRTEDLQISVLFSNGLNKIIHTFNPRVETWYQWQFEGLTITKANELIFDRTQKR